MTMQMQIKESSRNQWVLFGGLTLFVIALLFSLMSVFKLESSVAVHQQSTVIQNRIDDINGKIKDWAIYRQLLNSAPFQSRELYVKIKRAEKEIGYDFAQIEDLLLDSPEILRKVQALRLGWQLLHSKDSVIFLSDIEAFDNRFFELREAVADQLSLHEPAVIRGVHQLVRITSGLAILALALICYAALAIRKENAFKRDLLKSLKQSQEEALSASRLKSQFLATVSHEIRTPMNGIIGIADALRDMVTQPRERHFVEIILNSGKTLLRIINDILDFSKIESGTVSLERSEFSITDVVEQVVNTLSFRARQKNLELRYSLDSGLPSTILGDPDRLAQVLYNLVGNGIKFTQKGSVQIRIKSGAEGARMRIEVEDTGVGISQEDAEKLFVPFVQVHKAGTSGESGSGLGLSISQHLVGLMGGRIEVTSNREAGTLFSFEIPVNTIATTTIGRDINRIPTSALRESENPAPDVATTGRRILVVEDNPTNQIVAQSLLQQLGYQTSAVANGREAVDWVGANKADAILMDCQMPVMDGYEASREIRNRKVAIPIIALTADASRENEMKVVDAGMDGFISKPLTKESLREALRIILEQQSPLVAREVVAELSRQLGAQGSYKVIESFITSLSELVHLDVTDPKKSISVYNRIGHKFCSSAKIVGALGFAGLCADLEVCDSLTKCQLIHKKLVHQIPALSGSLRQSVQMSQKSY